VERADRLAAFLADELSADERQALEAELARDAGLRSELDAMRRGDAALAAVAPTALPDGARERLLQALAPTWDEQLGAAPDDVDELAARRQARDRRSWVTGLGGVAAALVAVAIIGPAIGGRGGDDSDLAATMEADTASDGGQATAEDAPATAFAPVGPTLLGSGRALDEETATELLAAGELEAVVAQGLSVDDARALGSSWAQAFGALPIPGGTFGTLDEEGVPTEEGAPAGEGAPADGTTEPDAVDPGPDGSAVGSLSPSAARELGTADLQLLGDVDEEARADVGRCLETLVAAGGVIVPALAELVTFGGEPAIAFGLVGVAPDDTVTRREVWVLARETCEIRYLRQG
jgi:hypothetical protein